MVKKAWVWMVVVLCAGAVIGLVALRLHRYKVTQTRFLIGTQVAVTVLAPKQQKALSLIDGIFTEIERLEKVYSDRLPDSELARINQTAGRDWVRVSGDMAEVLNLAFYWHEKSGGLFDITVGPLERLWGFKSGEDGHVPDEADLARVLAHVGMEKVKWDGQGRRVRFADQGVRLDVGGIAKLMILLKLDRYLNERQCYQYLVNLGGDVLAGQCGEIRKWKVGISDPQAPENIIARLEVEDTLVLTSGDYFRQFNQAGQRYHHILDPRTGKPREGVNAVTLVMPKNHPDPMPSIVVFLLGLEQGMALIEDLATVEGMISRKGRLFFSSGFSYYQIE